MFWYVQRRVKLHVSCQPYGLGASSEHLMNITSFYIYLTFIGNRLSSPPAQAHMRYYFLQSPLMKPITHNSQLYTYHHKTANWMI